jgi:transcriptional antiterminator
MQTDRDKIILLNEVRSNPALHIRDLAARFNVSRETIRTILISDGFYYLLPDIKTEIYPKNQIERIKFAEAHIHWFLQEW